MNLYVIVYFQNDITSDNHGTIHESYGVHIYLTYLAISLKTIIGFGKQKSI